VRRRGKMICKQLSLLQTLLIRIDPARKQ